jgi:hypothetical protein
LRSQPNAVNCYLAIGTGRRAKNPVNEVRCGSAWRASSCSEASPTSSPGAPRSTATWNTRGEQVLPLRSRLHPHLGKARRAQRLGPVDADAAGQLRVNGPPRFPIGQHSRRPPGRSNRHASRAAAVASAAKCRASMGTTASTAPSARPVLARSPTTNRAWWRARTARPGRLPAGRQPPRSPLRSAWRRVTGPATVQDRHGRSPGRPASSRVRGRGPRPRGQVGRPTQRSRAQSLAAGRDWLAARPAGGPETR